MALNINLLIISDKILNEFKAKVNFDASQSLEVKAIEKTPFDYFNFIRQYPLFILQK